MEGEKTQTTAPHLHLVSDATGETLNSVARACLVQFEGVEPREHVWSLVRTPSQMERVVEGIRQHPGPVIMTIINDSLRARLVEGCRELGVPCIPVLDPVIHTLAAYFGVTIRGRPGLQHALDAEYFERIEAVNFALSNDDGQQTERLRDADLIVLGVSRTSKTPTCIYLANRGIRAANVPVVPGIPLPDALFQLKDTLIVGLTKDPQQLVQDTKHGWPVIDVSRRSIEETAAAIMALYAAHREAQGR
ncbi:MAG: kinase/pyrophosphorylase [Limibacillus sp.]